MSGEAEMGVMGVTPQATGLSAIATTPESAPRDGWLPIASAPKYAGAIVALSPAWEGGKSPIVLRWFKYNGAEAWRDWDNDPHFPTHWLPWPSPPTSTRSVAEGTVVPTRQP